MAYLLVTRNNSCLLLVLQVLFYFCSLFSFLSLSFRELQHVFFFYFMSFLTALKMDHARVIDTSYVFKYQGQSSNRRPSLSNLCKVSHVFNFIRYIFPCHNLSTPFNAWPYQPSLWIPNFQFYFGILKCRHFLKCLYLEHSKELDSFYVDKSGCAAFL